ncbi:OmpA family protein [Psychrobacter sp. ANT_H56B]|uniref:OmpA family protein n=1 Tax=Psychrobacter sp. ANT_H56B TaxID=2597353 RepID=UPI0011F2BC94|nr:OmpA family protein [Psychrobacter sp. ANT_H56B]KAA0924198.1 OmpA family protein [Psychrobacter sp. ANT_H56B]
MIIKNHRTLLLLAASITLVGCQTTTVVPPKTTPQDENIRTMKAEIDSDGDGVSDKLDYCPNTPPNVMIDKNGCPPSLEITDKNFIKGEVRVYYDENSSEIDSKYFEELNRVGALMHKRLDIVIVIEAHISAREEKRGYQTLANNRAERFKSFLISKYQVNCNRIKTHGYGAEQPVASSDTDRYNRRLYAVFIDTKNNIENFNNSNGESCQVF